MRRRSGEKVSLPTTVTVTSKWIIIIVENGAALRLVIIATAVVADSEESQTFLWIDVVRKKG